jgi:flagellar hook-associated protein FlgK
MIVYKVDNQNKDAHLNAELREVAAELASVAPVLQRLQSIVNKHEETISAPSIVEFRSNLQRMVSDASSLTQRISQNSLTLIDVSEQASRYLTSIEEHYSKILHDSTPAHYRGTVTDKKQENTTLV